MAEEIMEQLPPGEDMLSEDYRRLWCGDTDATGHFVCRRIRDHKRDRHVGRNAAGGVHQWPVRGAQPSSGPADDPIGAVRVHPDDDPKRWDARRVMFVSTRTERPWWGIAGDPFGLAAMAHEEVRDWQPQSLAELAAVLGHPAATTPVDGDLRERLDAVDQVASRPAIPADAEGEFFNAIVDINARHSHPSAVLYAQACAKLVRSWLAPVSGSDTTPPSVPELYCGATEGYTGVDCQLEADHGRQSHEGRLIDPDTGEVRLFVRWPVSSGGDTTEVPGER